MTRSHPAPPGQAPLLLALGTEALAMTSYYLLYPSLPLFAAKLGGGNLAAGAMTGVLMLATVLVEPIAPRLARRFGYRRLIVGGILALGVSPLALIAAPSLALAMAVCALRGFGLAFVLVGVAAVVAEIVPPERRSHSFGLLGVVSSLPSFLLLPLGLGLASRGLYDLIFAVSSVAAIAGATAIWQVPDRAGDAAPSTSLRGVATDPGLALPVAGMFLAALAAGAVTTFLPMIAHGVGNDQVVLTLLANTVAMTLSRGIAGRLGEACGQTRLLVGALLLSILALAGLAVFGPTGLVVVPAAALGLAFGLVQNAAFSVMLQRSGPSAVGTVSAAWNIAYDAGVGAGAFGFGLVSTRFGCPAALIAATVVMAAFVVVLQVFGRPRGAAQLGGVYASAAD